MGLAATALFACAALLAWQLAENGDAEVPMLPYLVIVLAVCLTASCLAYWYLWKSSFDTPLARKRAQWRQKLPQQLQYSIHQSFARSPSVGP